LWLDLRPHILENHLVFQRFAGMPLEILRTKHGAMDLPQALRVEEKQAHEFYG
jgi:hypothetical protein